MGQEVSEAPAINIDDRTLVVLQELIYLESTITKNLPLNEDINMRIGKATSVMSRLAKRVWENSMLTENTKVRVCQACLISTLLYGSEVWTTYAKQDRKTASPVSISDVSDASKDVIYSELASDARCVGHPPLWFMDACHDILNLLRSTSSPGNLLQQTAKNRRRL